MCLCVSAVILCVKMDSVALEIACFLQLSLHWYTSVIQAFQACAIKWQTFAAFSCFYYTYIFTCHQDYQNDKKVNNKQPILHSRSHTCPHTHTDTLSHNRANTHAHQKTNIYMHLLHINLSSKTSSFSTLTTTHVIIAIRNQQLLPHVIISTLPRSRMLSASRCLVNKSHVSSPTRSNFARFQKLTNEIVCDSNVSEFVRF